MFSTKVRTTLIALVASASFAVASVAPAVSQAQWHNYCVAGHCVTHQNFTIGGVEPCAAISGNYKKAYEGLLEAIQTKNEQYDKVDPELTQAQAQANIEEAEAQVHLAEIAAFEWGCDIAARTSPTSVVSTPAGTLQLSSQGASTVSPVHATTATSSPLAVP